MINIDLPHLLQTQGHDPSCPQCLAILSVNTYLLYSELIGLASEVVSDCEDEICRQLILDQ